MSQFELSCNLCPQECFLCNNQPALLRYDSLCTKTHRWNSLNESSGRGTVAIRGRSTVEAEPVMKVNVKRAPSRSGEEWASPRKQWTQSSEGGRRGRESGWGQLFLINCFHVIDWLPMWWLAGRAHSLETLVKPSGDKLMEQLVTPSTQRHLWVSLGEGSLVRSPIFLSFFLLPIPFFLALSENKLLLPVFHISPVYVFNCVNRGWFVLEFLLSSHSVLHPPFSNTRAAWTKTFR